jgi:hypothetical protein
MDVYTAQAQRTIMDTPATAALQNFFLYFYGMVFNLMAVLAVSAWKGQGLAVLFQGQTAVTMLLIANNAAQVW